MPKRRSGANTVTPPHRSGAAISLGRSVGEREHEPAVDPDPIREPAVMPHAGGLLAPAQVLLPAEAEIALEAGAPLPADADPLSNLRCVTLRTDGATTLPTISCPGTSG